MPQTRALKLRQGRRIECGGPLPRLMGVLNATPDSFSDGGLHVSADLALSRALELLDEGADIVDIGGESTRPGAAEVPVDEEIRRVVPVVGLLRRERPDCAISVDTRKLEVAQAALDAGADLVNDVSGLEFSPGIAEAAAKAGAALAIMHMRGTPSTMQDPANLLYSDLLGEVSSFLAAKAEKAIACGVDPESILLDPGIGFAKDLAQNVELMARMEELSKLGFPLLAGPSRKRFIGVLGEEPDASKRDPGTCGAAAVLALKGVDFIRVHNVRAVRQALCVFCACLGKSSP